MWPKEVLLCTFWATLLCIGVNGKLTLKPEPVFTPLGTNATFRCETSDVGFVETIFWHVPSVGFEIVKGNTEKERQILANKGIYLQVEGALTLLTMAVKAENNMTHITCSEFSSIPVEVVTVQLIITGPPLPPAILSTVSNNISYTWQEPFTWPGHAIMEYLVQVEDSDGSSAFSVSADSMTWTYTHEISESVTNSCVPVNFTVRAISDVGWSDQSIVRTTLSRVPGMFGQINDSLNNSSDELLVIVQPPPLCGHQRGNVTLQIFNSSNSSVVQVEQSYSGQPENLLFKVDTENFRGEMFGIYTIVVAYSDGTTRRSASGQVQGDNLMTLFEKLATTDEIVLDNSANLSTEDIVIIVLAIVAGLALVLFLVLLITALILFLLNRKKSKKITELRAVSSPNQNELATKKDEETYETVN